MTKYFGTDGIRGKAGTGFFTTHKLVTFGQVLANVLGGSGTVVLGKDTRESGDFILSALSTGLMSGGVDVQLAGILPTPALSLTTVHQKADLGLMITASHNPYYDNGLKLFGADGRKLSTETQGDIETRLTAALDSAPSQTLEIFGTSSTVPIAEHVYIDHLLSSLPKSFDLKGRKLVLDLANGAGAHIGPKLFHQLGADFIAIGNTPNGRNINAGCGSTATDLMAQTVRNEGAALGIALDGDGDRLILVDETGAIIDGDQILAILARHAQHTGTLKTRSIIATIMSNLGLELWAKDHDLTLERTKVGDKYVGERMVQTGANIGGENSGHIIMTDYATTGDGLLAALHVLAAFQSFDGKMSDFAHVYTPSPQKLVNIRYGEENPLDKADIVTRIDALKADYAATANIVIRKSGTENLIRVMAQAETMEKVETIVAKAVAIIEG